MERGVLICEEEPQARLLSPPTQPRLGTLPHPPWQSLPVRRPPRAEVQQPGHLPAQVGRQQGRVGGQAHLEAELAQQPRRPLAEVHRGLEPAIGAALGALA